MSAKMKVKKPTLDRKKIAECYQPLFSHMSDEHGLILTVSEMDEILITCAKVIDSLNKLVDSDK